MAFMKHGAPSTAEEFKVGTCPACKTNEATVKAGSIKLCAECHPNRFTDEQRTDATPESETSEAEGSEP